MMRAIFAHSSLLTLLLLTGCEKAPPSMPDRLSCDDSFPNTWDDGFVFYNIRDEVDSIHISGINVTILGSWVKNSDGSYTFTAKGHKDKEGNLKPVVNTTNIKILDVKGDRYEIMVSSSRRSITREYCIKPSTKNLMDFFR